jgi:hypothetical protein
MDLLDQIQRRNASTSPVAPVDGAAEAEAEAESALMEALSSVLGGSAAGMPPDLLRQVAQHGDPRLFFQADNQDSFLNAANSVVVGGGNLAEMLTAAKQVKRSGGDMAKFYTAVQNVMAQGDYDDLEQFFSAVDVTVITGNSLEKLYQMSSRILGAASNDFESVIFAAQSAMLHRGSLGDFEKILDKTNFYGFEGRNNLVDFQRVLATARKAGMNTGEFLNLVARECADGANGRDLLDDCMAVFHLRSEAPDFRRFDRIERVDSAPMTIKQGDKAALFCQCVSVEDGLKPPSWVSWSSEETGAAGSGNYLDLSQLGPGTYHFIAKVTGGGDTAVKTVIIEPKGDHDNGHGNDPGKFDPSNPGKSKPVERAAYDAANAGSAEAPPAGSATSLVNSLAGLFAPAAGAEDLNPLLKMFRLYQLNADNLTATEVYDFIDKELGAGTSAAFLRSIGADQVAAEYEARDVKWESLYAAQIANPDFYDQCAAKFRSAVTADECAGFLNAEGETDPEIAESLWLLGYRTATVGNDHDNGHGNDPGKVDFSNPGRSKFMEKLETMKAVAKPIEFTDAEIEALFQELIEVTKQIEEIDRLIRMYASIRDAKNAESRREQQRQFWDQLLAFVNAFLANQAEESRDADAKRDEPEAESPKAGKEPPQFAKPDEPKAESSKPGKEPPQFAKPDEPKSESSKPGKEPPQFGKPDEQKSGKADDTGKVDAR